MKRARLADESKKVGKFGLVGITATAVHMLVFSLLLQLTSLSAVTANTYAFLCAVVFSFLGNRHWSFAQHSETRRREMFSPIKYVVVAVSGYLCNGLFAWLVVDTWMMPYGIALIPMVLLTPALSYVSIRLWVIREPS